VPSYLLEIAYSREAWSSLVRNPQDRLEAVRPVIEGLGGRITAAYFAFGEFDVVLIADYPDNVSAAAFSMAVTGGGAVKALRTRPLMTIDEGLQAMRKAGSAGYSPPGPAEIGTRETIEGENIADVIEELGGNP
jgi:uncharacterized protein with GYD domain